MNAIEIDRIQFIKNKLNIKAEPITIEVNKLRKETITETIRSVLLTIEEIIELLFLLIWISYGWFKERRYAFLLKSLPTAAEKKLILNIVKSLKHPETETQIKKIDIEIKKGSDILIISKNLKKPLKAIISLAFSGCDRADKKGITDAIENISDIPANVINIGRTINCFLLLEDRFFQMPLIRIILKFFLLSINLFFN